MTLSRELTIALSLALDEARERNHEFITLEHVLFALLSDPSSAECLEACGADLKKVEAELEAFFLTLDKVPADEAEDLEPAQTDTFRRVLNRAALHVQSSGKTEIRGPNVLVALFSEQDSPAVHMLQTQGVEKLDVTSFIAHGRRKVPAQRRMEGAGADAEARECVGKAGRARGEIRVGLAVQALVRQTRDHLLLREEFLRALPQVRDREREGHHPSGQHRRCLPRAVASGGGWCRVADGPQRAFVRHFR